MRRKTLKQTLLRLLCAIGWHQSIGVTIGGYIRCYACSKSLHAHDKVWRSDSPPDLRTNEEQDADELRRVLDDLTTALWNSEQFTPSPEYEAAMIALGYRKVDQFWMKP